LTNKNLIIGDKIIFKKKKKEWLFFHQRSFELELSEIDRVGIRLGQFFDEDYFVYVFVTNQDDYFYIRGAYLNQNDRKVLSNKLRIDLDMEIEKLKNVYSCDKIVFPKGEYGKHLFKKPSFFGKMKYIFKLLLFNKHYTGINW